MKIASALGVLELGLILCIISRASSQTADRISGARTAHLSNSSLQNSLNDLPTNGNVNFCGTYLSYGTCSKCESNYFISTGDSQNCSQCQALNSEIGTEHSTRFKVDPNAASTCATCTSTPGPKRGLVCSSCLDKSYFDSSRDTCV